MTLALPGWTAQLYVADDLTTFVKIGELRELTLDVERDMLDTTSHDSAGLREFIYGLEQWSITGSTLHITANAGQVDVRAAILARTQMNIELRETDVTGDPQWSGLALVSAQSLSFPVDDAMTGDITLQGTGLLTEELQA